MQNLVVCVGERCHQCGAEIVLKSFKDAIARENLEQEICLKCSFTMGVSCEGEKVSVRLGDRIFEVDPEQAHESFIREVMPTLLPATEA